MKTAFFAPKMFCGAVVAFELVGLLAGGPAAAANAPQLRARYASAFARGPYVLEYARVASLVSDWSLENGELDPFGLVLWPGAEVLAEELASGELDVRGSSTLELGCGTGLCSLVCASLGASTALATDANPETLDLVVAAASRQGLKAVRTEVFDMASDGELPSGIDLLLAADVCYSDTIARALAARCAQASAAGIRAIITDSVNIARAEFAGELRRLGVEFERADLTRSFTGHAVSLDAEVERKCSVALFQI